jgi:uncharacterized membrane protein
MRKNKDEGKRISRNQELFDVAAYIICFLFILAGILVSLNRYWQYEAFYYDFGIFDQAIWNVAHFHAPVIEHYIVGGKWIFADHFNPSIFLLSPLYWLTSRREVLLVTQAVIVGLSGYVIHEIGKKIIKNSFLPLCVLVSYFLFLGLQNAVITEFHEVTISLFTLSLIFWASIHKKKFLYFLFLILTLGFKEIIFFAGIGIGISIFFIRKEWYKPAIATIIISLVWGILSLKFIIPSFSGGIYQYTTAMPTNPMVIMQNLFIPAEKLRTIWYSFLSFGFLPLLSPGFFALFFQDFAIRFIPDWPIHWGLGLHYSALLSVFLAVSSLFSLKKLSLLKLTKKYVNIVGIVMVMNALFLYRFILHGPFGLAYNSEFYRHTNDFEFLSKMNAKIPIDAIVMTHNDLALRFSHKKIYLLLFFLLLGLNAI